MDKEPLNLILTSKENDAADFIEDRWLVPHNSRLTGSMIVHMKRWYGLEYSWYLAVTGAETSLADPLLGGKLVWYNNFGCVKAGKPDTPWGKLASGTVRVRGIDWWAWPSPWDGAAALGRLLKVAPTFNKGYYMRAFQAGPDWEMFSKMYHGEKVSGYEHYLDNITHLYDVFHGALVEEGFED